VAIWLATNPVAITDSALMVLPLNVPRSPACFPRSYRLTIAVFDFVQFSGMKV
jgi:hypothetical protein